MDFKNTLLGLMLLPTQALLGSAAASGFGSPVPSPQHSPRALRSGFGVHSPLTVGSAAAVGSALRSDAFSPTEDEMTRLTLAAGSAFKKEDDEQQKLAALQAAAVHASLTTDAPAQQKLDAALSTDDTTLSTDAADGAIAAAATSSIKTAASLSKPTDAPQTVASIALATAVLAPAKPKVDAPASAAVMLAAHKAAEQKDRKEQAALAPKWVNKMVRFKKAGEPHAYDVPACYDENEQQTVATRSGKIPASLGKAFKYNLDIQSRMRCSHPQCKRECDRYLKLEDCEVSIHELAPKVVKVAITQTTSSGHPDCPTESHTPLGTFDYDLNDPSLAKIAWVHSTPRFSFPAIPHDLLLKILRAKGGYCSDNDVWYKALTLSLTITDLQPEPVFEAAAPTYPKGNKQTRLDFSAAGLICKGKYNQGKPCNFNFHRDTGLNELTKDAQQRHGRQLVLHDIAQGGTSCYHQCGNKSSDLSHFTDALKVDVWFPSYHGSA